jgi:hypothetical protein
MVISGLEALLKVGRDRLQQQFVQRTTALADELSIDGVTGEFCKRMYGARSDWVNGSHVQLFGPPIAVIPGEPEIVEAPETDEERSTVSEVAKLQDLLRVAVRRCAEDATFRATFTSDEAIRQRWPASDT